MTNATASPTYAGSTSGDDATFGSTALIDRRAGSARASDINKKCLDVLLMEVSIVGPATRGNIKSGCAEWSTSASASSGSRTDTTVSKTGRKIMRGVRGLINELYIDGLRAKTHRAQPRRCLPGMSPAAKASDTGSFATAIRTTRRVAPTRSIRASGVGPLQLRTPRARRRLPEDRTRAQRTRAPSPRGNTWCVSAWYGSPQQGSGMPNNVLYEGRSIWNRSRWVQDLDIKRRQRADRPVAEWHHRNVPQVRIIDAATWDEVRTRIDRGRDLQGRKPASRPPSTLFGGTMKYPYCTGTLTAVDAQNDGCRRKTVARPCASGFEFAGTR